MSNNWSRIVNTTITKYLRDNQPAILRNRVLPALLEKKGRLTFNCTGLNFEWKVPYKRYQVTPYVDGGMSVFSRKDRVKSANLEYRSYEINDSITDWEKLKNRGREAIINVLDQMGKDLASDAGESFATEMYNDGNATGYTDRIHGTDSFLGYTAPAAQTKVAVNNDTYAGLSTVLGTYGGSGASWPDGNPDYQYDFWTPVIIGYLAAATGGFAASTPSWKNNCIEALRYGINVSQRDNGKDSQLDVIIMGGSMYRDFESQLDSKEQVIVNRGADNDVVALGFQKSVNFEGVPITWEVGVGGGSTVKAYGFCINQMEVMCMQDQLFKMSKEYPLYVPERKSYVSAVDFYGNLKFKSPRHFPLWTNTGS